MVITSAGNGNFTVSGNHTYSQGGTFYSAVTITLAGNRIKCRDDFCCSITPFCYPLAMPRPPRITVAGMVCPVIHRRVPRLPLLQKPQGRRFLLPKISLTPFTAPATVAASTAGPAGKGCPKPAATGSPARKPGLSA